MARPWRSTTPTLSCTREVLTFNTSPGSSCAETEAGVRKMQDRTRARTAQKDFRSRGAEAGRKLIIARNNHHKRCCEYARLALDLARAPAGQHKTHPSPTLFAHR